MRTLLSTKLLSMYPMASGFWMSNFLSNYSRLLPPSLLADRLTM